MASPMLSKEVIPALGPAHFSRQTETLVSQMLAPHLSRRFWLLSFGSGHVGGGGDYGGMEYRGSLRCIWRVANEAGRSNLTVLHYLIWGSKCWWLSLCLTWRQIWWQAWRWWWWWLSISRNQFMSQPFGLHGWSAEKARLHMIFKTLNDEGLEHDDDDVDHDGDGVYPDDGWWWLSWSWLMFTDHRM